MITIRYASPGDALAVFKFVSELEQRNFDESLFVKCFHKLLDHADKIHLIAESEGIPVGYLSCYGQVLLHHLGMVFEIQEMYIVPEKRKTGVGKKMIFFLKKELGQRNCSSLEVTTKIERADAIRFYENCGLKKTHFKFSISNE